MRADLYDDIAEWAFARRDFDRRGDELLLLAQAVMDEDEILGALNDVVKDFYYDRYSPAEMRAMMLAVEGRLARAADAAAWMFTHTGDGS